MAVTETAGEASGAPTAAGPRVDERLAHRGPMQRLLARPEIGALIGVSAIWTMFWLATKTFGTAAGAASYLDIAANAGVVAVFVSMLIIGGEFDLSAGVMTGTTGILVGLIATEAGGKGISLWVAVPLGFLFAAGVGYWNAQFVLRTALPSFIITLSTQYMLTGSTLGFNKQITNKVFVDKIDDAHGYKALKKIFASVYSHEPFTGRNQVYTILLLLGMVIGVFGLLELSYRRRAKPNPAGVPILLAGIAGVAVGFIGLLSTDGVGANWGFGAVTGAGIVASMLGLARTRYEAGLRQEQPAGMTARAALQRAAVGLVLVGLGLVVSKALHAERKKKKLLFVTTEQGMRAILVGVLLVAGVVFLGLAVRKAAANNRLRLAIAAVLSVVVLIVMLIIQSESKAPKLRVHLFTLVLFLTAMFLAAEVVEFFHPKRTVADSRADRRGRVLSIAGVVLIVLGVAIHTLFSGATFRIAILWYLVFTAAATFVLLRTRFGSWTFAVGGNVEAARSVGVPIVRVKRTLFILVSLAGCWAGMMAMFQLKSVQANQGLGKELEYVVAAVVGGNLLTGGYGSVAGAAMGSLVTAFTAVGIPYAGWNSNWNSFFLGAILLASVLVNRFIRRRAAAARR